jgi:hypothetical protein
MIAGGAGDEEIIGSAEGGGVKHPHLFSNIQRMNRASARLRPDLRGEVHRRLLQAVRHLNRDDVAGAREWLAKAREVFVRHSAAAHARMAQKVSGGAGDEEIIGCPPMVGAALPKQSSSRGFVASAASLNKFTYVPGGLADTMRRTIIANQNQRRSTVVKRLVAARQRAAKTAAPSRSAPSRAVSGELDDIIGCPPYPRV